MLPIIIIGYLTLFSGVFSVSEVDVTGLNNVSRDEIIKQIPLGANILFIDSSEIQKNILSSVSEIDEVKIYKGIPNAIKIIVKENEASSVWSTEGKYYLLNQNGFAYKEIWDLNNINSIPRVIDNKNIQISLSQRLVSDRFMAFLEFLNENIYSRVNLSPEYYFIEETTVDLYLKTQEGIIIKFDSLRDPEQQIDNLKVVLMEKREEIKEYVDLRVSGWVYYK